MKLLILPSHRLMFYHGKMLLSLLPQSLQAQQYTNLNSGITAMYHYKTVSIYKTTDIIQLSQKHTHHKQHTIKPLISQIFQKKVQTIDLYHTTNQKNNQQRQCIISDKFGDMYKINIDIPSSPLLSSQVNKQSSIIKNLQNSQKKYDPIYINSNLGIPKYIKHIILSNLSGKDKIKQYLILGDQQNKIKIYNSLNPHQLISVWFMINMYSIQCHIIINQDKQKQNHKQVSVSVSAQVQKYKQNKQHFHNYPIVIMLLKYYNKLTLEQNIKLHYFIASPNNLQSYQYPGIEIQSILQKQKKINIKQCKYYTSINIKIKSKHHHNNNNKINGILLMYLFENKIIYQIFQIYNKSQQHIISIKSIKIGELAIQEGKWDYLYAIDTEQNNNIIIAYGCDVQMPIDIQIKDKSKNDGKDGKDGKGQVQKQKQNDRYLSLLKDDRISLNKYQKIVKLELTDL